jgi:aspartyl-tRNA(Asn)/glutamyl-tRNA(Gln) amidotransferase subunit C
MQINLPSMMAYLEDLSNLTFSDEEKKRLTDELQDILKIIDRITCLDTGGVSEYSHPLDSCNFLRNDEVRPSFDRNLILKNAPVKSDEFFIAPKTVE